MKKLYTLMLAAASASMMFAEMPIMQQQLSIGMPNPIQMPTEKTELVNLYNQFTPAKTILSRKAATRFNAPARAEEGMTCADLCNWNFVQDYSTFLNNQSGRVEVEFCGDLYFTPGKGENEVVMTGLFGFQEVNMGIDFSLKGTFDAATQTVTIPYEQLVYRTSSYNVYFTGFAYILNEDKTDVVDTRDYTEEDALVLSIQNFYGQHAMKVEGAWDNTWDEIPAFGFLAVSPQNEAMGWFDLTVGETFYIAQANAAIEYDYVVFLDDQGDDYTIETYTGNALLNIMPLEEGGDNAIQAGPFIQTGFGCPVMFVYDYGQYVANDTFEVGKKEYKNPAYMNIGDDSYYYLYEITEYNNELGVYLNVTTTEEGMFESCEFDCTMWTAKDEVNGYWFGYSFPATVTALDLTPAGINDITVDKAEDSRWFNLQGIEVNKANLQKGNIYINNGKKVLVK